MSKAIVVKKDEKKGTLIQYGYPDYMIPALEQIISILGYERALSKIINSKAIYSLPFIFLHTTSLNEIDINIIKPLKEMFSLGNKPGAESLTDVASNDAEYVYNVYPTYVILNHNRRIELKLKNLLYFKKKIVKKLFLL